MPGMPHAFRLRPALALALLTACSGSGGKDSDSASDTTQGSGSPTTEDPPTSTSAPTTGTGVTPTTGVTAESLGTDGTDTTIGATTDASGDPGSDTHGSSTSPIDTQSSTVADTTTTGTSDTTQGDTSTGTTADDTTGAPALSDIEIVITADNAYAFAYGTEVGIAKYYGGVEAVTAGQIFNCGEGPETYVVPAEETENATYLYIIAWADSAVTQGVLGRFRRLGGGGGFGENVFTGTDGWEACATGVDYQPGQGGPPLAQINEYIGHCNKGELDPAVSSKGWVDAAGVANGAVAFGEANTTPYDGGPKAGNEFPLVCPDVMPAEARWMWYNWDPANVKPPMSPFLWPGGGGNPDKQFLIFRLAAELLPDPL